MVLAMARPTRRPESRFPLARKVVPKDVQAILGRTEFKQALRGGTPAEINTQHRTLLDRWEAEIETAHARSRGELRRLTNREVWTMVGE